MRIGIDIGGMFTDFVSFNEYSGTVEAAKLLPAPDDPAQAVLEGLKLVRGESQASEGAIC